MTLWESHVRVKAHLCGMSLSLPDDNGLYCLSNDELNSLIMGNASLDEVDEFVVDAMKQMEIEEPDFEDNEIIRLSEKLDEAEAVAQEKWEAEQMEKREAEEE